MASRGPTAEQVKADAKAKVAREQADLATRWLKAIDKRRDKERNWREDKAPKIIDRYRDDRSALNTSLSRFNILYSNVETLKPAIFSRMPVPDVRRRFTTADNVSRTAALIVERSLAYCQDSYSFNDVLDRVNEDALLPGRGQAVVRYKPFFGTTETRIPVDPVPEGDDTVMRDENGAYRMVPQEELLYQEVYADYVAWDLFVFDDCSSWDHCHWVALGALLTKEQAKNQYPNFDWEKVSFNRSPKGKKDDDASGNMVLVWDVWHKTSRQFIVLVDGFMDGVVAQMDDPLHLEGFFPCPEPIYTIRTNRDWTPIPEYVTYQDQARELDECAERLSALTSALKIRGVYDQSFDNENVKLGELLSKPDLTLIPIASFRTLVEKGGLKSIVDTMPLEEIAAVTEKLNLRVEMLKQAIYEITGISDVVRGATKASETLGAQQLKAKYAGMRISARQGRFQRFIRDIYRIKAELIAEHFEPQVLQMISGINVIPDQQWVMLKQQKQIPAGAVSETEFSQALQLVKSSKLRGFKIDVETDSTIPEDKTEEQDKRVQFITALSQYLANALPAVQQGLLPAAIAREGMLFAVRAFKVGSELEEVLEQLGTDDEAASLKEQIQQLQPQLQQAQEENQQLKDQNQQLQSKAQIEMQKAQAKAQTDQFSAQQKAQLDQASAAHSTQLEDMKAAHDAQIKQSQADHDAAIKEREAEQDMRIKELEARQDAMLKERDARQEAALKERDAQHSQALQTQQARVDQMTQQMAQKPSNIQVQPTDMTEVSDKLDTIAEGQTKVLEAILALVQSNSATRTKKGRAKLPSGGMIEFETSDGVSH